MRRSGGLLSAEILAALFGENKGTTGSGVGVGGSRQGRGCYLRGSRLVVQANRGNRVAGVRFGAESGLDTR